MSNKNDNNNFFNDNPLLAFAIFSIVIILIFKVMIGEGNGSINSFSSKKAVSMTKRVSYSEIKKLIRESKISQMKITPTTIEAIGEDSNRVIRYVAEKVPANDPTLIKLLDEKGVNYSGVMGNGFVSELISMLLPIIIFFAIWIFLARRMSKGVGGGILGVGKAWKLINSENQKVNLMMLPGVDEA